MEFLTNGEQESRFDLSSLIFIKENQPSADKCDVCGFSFVHTMVN